jgi:hypothetical protein
MPIPLARQVSWSATAVWWLRHHALHHVRYEVIGLIFLVMTVNLADRAAMSIASTPMSA